MGRGKCASDVSGLVEERRVGEQKMHGGVEGWVIAKEKKREERKHTGKKTKRMK